MQQRQPRLGDVLDDYCPRERRVTNHVVVAIIGEDVKQTRCSTCDADHEYKQAKVPRVRRKTEAPAALAAQGFGVPKLHDVSQKPADDAEPVPAMAAAPVLAAANPENLEHPENSENLENAEHLENSELDADGNVQAPEEGPVHRRLIRASLPRVEGQAPPTRPNPEFTIRQPNNGRQNRFRPRHGGQGQSRGGGGGPMQSSGNGNGNRSFGGGGFGQRQHGPGGGSNNQSRRQGGGGGRNRGK